MDDFQHEVSDDRIKVYPSLLQKNYLTQGDAETYLEIGKSTNGVIYFEETDSWGGRLPRIVKGKTKVRLAIKDCYGKVYKKTFNIPLVSLEDAQKYNPSFGKTYSKLNNQSNPKNFDVIEYLKTSN